VRLPSSSQRPDPKIARAAVTALEWNTSVPKDRVKVKVENGWLTLEGNVDWFYQKEAAERRCGMSAPPTTRPASPKSTISWRSTRECTPA